MAMPGIFAHADGVAEPGVGVEIAVDRELGRVRHEGVSRRAVDRAGVSTVAKCFRAAELQRHAGHVEADVRHRAVALDGQVSAAASRLPASSETKMS